MSIPQTYKILYCAIKKGLEPTMKELPIPTLKKNEVLVKVAFAAINPIDVILIKNLWDDQPEGPVLAGYENATNLKPAGFEGSGIVAAVGEDLKYPVKVGDRVHIRGPGAMAQYYATVSENVFPIQNDLSLEDAASHHINPVTIQYMMETVEKQNPKAIIQTAAASALGRMLIRALKQRGIKSINIVRRNDYVEELKKEGADYVLNSTDADFEARLKEIATKEQATVSFEAIGGDFSGKVLTAQPPNSILYLYGDLAGATGINFISIGDLFQGKSVAGHTVTHYFAEKEQKEETRKVLSEAHSLLSTIYKGTPQIYKSQKL